MKMNKDNNKLELENFLPDHELALLTDNMKIEEPEVPEQQIEDDLRRLMKQPAARKRRRFILSTASVAAACAAICLMIVWGIGNERGMNDNTLAYSLLDSADVKTEDIQIIAGTSQLNIKDSATIKQTDEGGVIVDEKEITDSFITQTEYLQLVVPFGKRSTVNFSDGTIVWVNSGTTIVYPHQFNKDKREIFVDGEIYLEVAKDKSRPFIVHSKKFDIAVLGTKFNVSSYNNDPTASVVLVEGSVEVLANKTKNKLSPNQGLFYENNIAEIKQVDVYPYICWKDGVMKLNGESLDVIFNRLARYYRVEFEYDRKIANERYKGKLNLSESIDNILYNLSLATDFTYEKEGTMIYIK